MNETVERDLSVGRNVNVGGEINVQGALRVGHDLVVEGWLDAKNIKGPLKGLFVTEALLREAYPRPERGWYALVGTGLPADVWVANRKREWEPTGETGGNPNTDIAAYDATVRSLDRRVANLDFKAFGGLADTRDSVVSEDLYDGPVRTVDIRYDPWKNLFFLRPEGSECYYANWVDREDAYSEETSHKAYWDRSGATAYWRWGNALFPLGLTAEEIAEIRKRIEGLEGALGVETANRKLGDENLEKRIDGLIGRLEDCESDGNALRGMIEASTEGLNELIRDEVADRKLGDENLGKRIDGLGIRVDDLEPLAFGGFIDSSNVTIAASSYAHEVASADLYADRSTGRFYAKPSGGSVNDPYYPTWLNQPDGYRDGTSHLLYWERNTPTAYVRWGKALFPMSLTAEELDAIQSRMDELESAIDGEAEARKASTEAWNEAVRDEVDDRKLGDENLGKRIDGVLERLGDCESDGNALRGMIEAEAGKREKEVEQVCFDLQDEIDTRIERDIEIEDKVTAEAEARAAAEKKLSNRISDLETDRPDWDAAYFRSEEAFYPNLLDGTKDSVITPSWGVAQQAYAQYKALYFAKDVVMEAGDVFAISVSSIEQIEGSPEGYSVSLYSEGVDGKLGTNLGSSLVLTQEKLEGTIEVKNDLPEGHRAVLLIFPGINGQLIGCKARFGRIMLVKKSTPEKWGPSRSELARLPEMDAELKMDRDGFIRLWKELGYVPVYQWESSHSNVNTAFSSYDEESDTFGLEDVTGLSWDEAAQIMGQYLGSIATGGLYGLTTRVTFPIRIGYGSCNIDHIVGNCKFLEVLRFSQYVSGENGDRMPVYGIIGNDEMYALKKIYGIVPNPSPQTSLNFSGMYNLEWVEIRLKFPFYTPASQIYLGNSSELDPECMKLMVEQSVTHSTMLGVVLASTVYRKLKDSYAETVALAASKNITFISS